MMPTKFFFYGLLSPPGYRSQDGSTKWDEHSLLKHELSKCSMGLPIAQTSGVILLIECPSSLMALASVKFTYNLLSTLFLIKTRFLLLCIYSDKVLWDNGLVPCKDLSLVLL